MRTSTIPTIRAAAQYHSMLRALRSSDARCLRRARYDRSAREKSRCRAARTRAPRRTARPGRRSRRRKGGRTSSLAGRAELADGPRRIEEHLAQLLHLGRGGLQVLDHELPVRVLESREVLRARLALQLDDFGARLLHLLELALGVFGEELLRLGFVLDQLLLQALARRVRQLLVG